MKQSASVQKLSECHRPNFGIEADCAAPLTGVPTFFSFFYSLPTQSQAGKQEHKLSKTEGMTHGSLNAPHGQTDLSVKPDNVKIKGLQANVSIPKVRPVTPDNERPQKRRPQATVWPRAARQRPRNLNPECCCKSWLDLSPEYTMREK